MAGIISLFFWMVTVFGTTFLLFRFLSFITKVEFQKAQDKTIGFYEKDVDNLISDEVKELNKGIPTAYTIKGSKKHIRLSQTIIVICCIWFFYWFTIDGGYILVKLGIIEKRFWQEHFCGDECYDYYNDKWYD
jgi:hypothetical protein